MRPNVKVSQFISVPVFCVANNAAIDVNKSYYNVTSSLNLYRKLFESKTLCAYNTFASDPSNLRMGGYCLTCCLFKPRVDELD